ncbi:hypothetical protein BaRGS_00026678, partial [Batillaria attramentaria]
ADLPVTKDQGSGREERCRQLWRPARIRRDIVSYLLFAICRKPELSNLLHRGAPWRVNGASKFDRDKENEEDTSLPYYRDVSYQIRGAVRGHMQRDGDSAGLGHYRT